MKRLLLAFMMGILFSQVLAQDNYQDWVQEQNIPNWFYLAVKDKNITEKYDYSFKINPFYLRGDFNGDNKVDVACLISEKESNKIGILIFHSSSNDYFILGAGIPFGNGGDNFSWMNIWQVHAPEEMTKYRDIENRFNPHCEGIYAEKGESGGGIIYWDGSNYNWKQAGD